MYSSTTSCVRQQTSLFVGEVVKEDSEDHPTFVLNLQNVSLSPSIPSLQDYYLPKNQAGTYPLLMVSGGFLKNKIHILDFHLFIIDNNKPSFLFP